MITQLHDAIAPAETSSNNPRAENIPSVAPMPVTKDASDTDEAEGDEQLLAGVPAMSDGGVTDLVKVFKLLSDETRLRILLYLTRCPELHVRALCDRLGQSQPAVSHHLALLRVAGLIESRREGKHNFYHLVPQRFEQLLEMVFETVPGEDRQIRLQDYVLRYAPQGELV